MKEIIINVSDCTTALQFLAVVSKALGKLIGTFSMLNQYLLTNHYSKITFLNMKDFSARCPQAMKELEVVLKRVQWHYQQEGNGFEYYFQP